MQFNPLSAELNFRYPSYSALLISYLAVFLVSIDYNCYLCENIASARSKIICAVKSCNALSVCMTYISVMHTERAFGCNIYICHAHLTG